MLVFNFLLSPRLESLYCATDISVVQLRNKGTQILKILLSDAQFENAARRKNILRNFSARCAGKCITQYFSMPRALCNTYSVLEKKLT